MTLVRYTVRGLTPFKNRMKAYNRKISRAYTPGLIKAANKIGEVWKTNYEAEGGNYKKWPDLSEVTQAIRAEQNFDPQHPILVRSGAMKRVVTDRVIEAKQQGSWTQTDNYVKKPTTLKISGGNGRPLTLQAFGWKVSNQDGFTSRAPTKRSRNAVSRIKVPARPFWFVDNAVNDAAMRGFEEWLSEETRKV
jgi:hypothetical protein